MNVSSQSLRSIKIKVIIAGSRSILKYSSIELAVYNASFIGIDILEVVSGTAKGVDTLGEMYAINNNIGIKYFPADWNTYNKGAGYIRNIAMAEYADASIIIWDGKSKGTKHMISMGIKYNLLQYVLKI